MACVSRTAYLRGILMLAVLSLTGRETGPTTTSHLLMQVYIMLIYDCLVKDLVERL